MFGVTETHSDGLVKKEYIGMGSPAIGIGFGNVIAF